jgi:hypothetical protein
VDVDFGSIDGFAAEIFSHLLCADT